MNVPKPVDHIALMLALILQWSIYRWRKGSFRSGWARSEPQSDRPATLHKNAGQRNLLAGVESFAGSRVTSRLRQTTIIAARFPWLGKHFTHSRAMRRHKFALSDVFNLVPVALLGIDQRDENVVYANDLATELFGYDKSELIGRPACSLFPGLRSGNGFGLPDILAQGLNVFSGPEQTVVASRSTGHELPVLVTGTRLQLNGVPIYLAAIVNRTEQYGLNRNLGELTHLTRVSALGELAGSLAHELNQPLTAMLSNAQAAQRFLDADPVNEEEVRDTLKDIVADSCRAGDIIKKIRALVRKSEMERLPIDVGGVVRDAALLVHSDAIVRNIRIRLDIANDLPRVPGDKVQLQQVLLNLLLNSFDAMRDCAPPDRVVTLKVSAQTEDAVRVMVRDHGHGLTTDQKEKIFEPFFTSKQHGLGLGLSISRTIVAAHGGHIWAENNPDGGATFYVELPTEHVAGQRDREKSHE
jgi:two-component system, LuxR family, sensor kinase FixL